MKQFVVIIKAQIQQLKNLSLREWLLSHLNEDANNLKELFNKQIPAYSKQALGIAPFSEQLPPHLSFLSIFYTYAPESLRQQLTKKLSEFPELMHEDEATVERRLNRELSQQLTDFHDAWPIIAALQKQEASDLIKILEAAGESALSAFVRLTKGSDLAILAEIFLINNSHELEMIDRNKLIQFLRQPDLSSWLTEYLESLVFQSANAMSLKLLMLTFTPSRNEQDKLQKLRTFLEAYPFSIHLETILAVISSYAQELQKAHGALASKHSIFLLHDLVKRVDILDQSTLVNGLNQESLLFIIEQCLKGCVSNNVKFHQVCMDLLFVFCSESVVSKNDNLALIKERLGQPDAYLFDTSELFLLAKQIMATPEESSGWIQQLVTSPHFVAASSAKVLKQLSDRYFLLNTTLNQKEYSQAILSFQEAVPHFDEIQSKMFRLKQNRLSHPEKSEVYAGKRNRLLKFSSEGMVHALLWQLEKNCEQQRTGNFVNAEKALGVLFGYYSQVYPNLRTDLLLSAVDYAYSPKVENTADFTQRESTLLQWLRDYYPQHQLISIESLRKKEVKLYNSSGKKIGFLNEAKEAMAFVGEEPVLIVKTGSIEVNDPFYDEQGSLIGYLTESGHVKSADLFQKNVSARLLALVPVKDLEQSSYGLSLLVRNALLEESLDALYTGGRTAEKNIRKLWLEQLLMANLKDAEQEYSPHTFCVLVEHHSDEALFTLLGTMKNKANAKALFHAILKHDKKRELLFNGSYESKVQLYLDRHGAVQCLADYMMHSHDKLWFADGLLCFTAYGKGQKKSDLLADALSLLATDYGADGQKAAPIDLVMHGLLKTEASARILVQEFFNDRTQMAVQEQDKIEINEVIQYVDKNSLLTALRTLNKVSDWENSSLYKLVLYVLETQHARLFPSKEFHLVHKPFWQGNELDNLVEFVIRHLSNKSPLDKDLTLGYRVLGELIFRCAHSGQASLFYSKKIFNRAIARLSFTRPFLERLIDKFWIPEGIKEQFSDTLPRIKALFDEKSGLQKELEHDLLLADWRHLVNQTWKEINKKKLPIICAYLLNYSGSKKPLLFLLNDYFSVFQKVADYLHPVSKLMQQFPQRDVSAVIFDALEAILIKKPQLLDKTILQHMAYYYNKKIAHTESKSPQAELNLLTYFGQNKHYALAQKGCQELVAGCKDNQLKSLLLKGALEAEIEADLGSSSGRFYFILIKIIKRLWHYGFNAKKNASGIVKFCDDMSAAPARNYAVDQVKTPAAGGKVSYAYLEFSEKRKQLIKLLATIKHSSVPSSLSGRLSQSNQSLFHTELPGTSRAQEKVVARVQAVVNI